MTSTARHVALGVVDDVLARNRTLDEAFARNADFARLEARDRAFARLLAATVLRRMGEIDKILQGLLHEPFSALRPRLALDVLRLGVAQLVFLETPAHAAVSTTVDLMEDCGCGHHAALANAVLRRLTREAPARLDARDAGRANAPDWLWNVWAADYGVEKALDICAANMEEAPLDITVKSDPEGWAKKLQAQVLPNGTLRRAAGGSVTALPGFAEGEWWVQNLAASLPAQMLGDVAGKTVIDLCAAPGGKTAQLAAAGARVTAVDRSASRMKRLRENMQRLKLEVETVIADAGVWQPAEMADIVLLDAPCTATGTIRHEPDVLRLKQPQDMAKLSALQKKLLDAAAGMVKPGGLLLFCTCAIQKDEGERQAKAFIDRHPQFKNAPPETPFRDLLDSDGFFRSLPCDLKEIGGIDGFFVARFARS